MYIAIYISAIVVFGAVFLGVFLFMRKKDKQRMVKLQENVQNNYDNMPLQPNIEQSKADLHTQNETTFEEFGAESKSHHDNQADGSVKTQDVEKENMSIEQAQFEDFSLDEDKKETQKQDKFMTVGGKKFDKLFDFEDDFETDFPKLNDDDKLTEDEIAQYEKTLRENLKFDMDEEFEKFNKRKMPSFEESAPFSDMSDFDVEKFRGKSEAEIMDMIKDLPPKAQEIILTDILARKNWDD